MLELVRYQKQELPMAAGAEEVIYSAGEMILMENRNKQKFGNMSENLIGDFYLINSYSKFTLSLYSLKLTVTALNDIL